MKARLLTFIALISLSPASSYAATITYTAVMNGASESPATVSLGTGFDTVIINDVANTMEVIVSFSGLSGTTTAAHIHCCTAAPDSGNAGVATTTPYFAGFPIGVTSGTYDSGLLDLTAASTYNPSFVTAQGGVANAEVALLAGLAADEAYLNIHTTVDPSGEIRGLLDPAAPAQVPEPATLSLLGLGLAIGSVRAWRARRVASN